MPTVSVGSLSLANINTTLCGIGIAILTINRLSLANITPLYSDRRDRHSVWTACACVAVRGQDDCFLISHRISWRSQYP